MKNTRDAVVVIIAVIVIAVSGYFAYTMLFPAPKDNAQNQSQSTSDTKYLDPSIDNQTYSNLEKLSPYPTPNLDNIGRSDIFAKF